MMDDLVANDGVTPKTGIFEPTEEPVQQKRMIALCDILGFTKLVENNPLERVVDEALGWLRKVLHQSLYRDDFPENVPPLQLLQSHPQVGFAWFSDTLLFYTHRDCEEHCRALISTMAWLLFETIHDPDTRLRCGISYGETYIDGSIGLYVGKPIIEAYELQSAQEWSGGALSLSAQARLPPGFGHFPNDWPVIPYAIPLKTDHLRSNLALDWTIGLHYRGFSLPWSAASDTPSTSEREAMPDVCDKWKNTVQFHDQVCKSCNRVK